MINCIQLVNPSYLAVSRFRSVPASSATGNDDVESGAPPATRYASGVNRAGDRVSYHRDAV